MSPRYPVTRKTRQRRPTARETASHAIDVLVVGLRCIKPSRSTAIVRTRRASLRREDRHHLHVPGRHIECRRNAGAEARQRPPETSSPLGDAQILHRSLRQSEKGPLAYPVGLVFYTPRCGSRHHGLRCKKVEFRHWADRYLSRFTRLRRQALRLLRTPAGLGTVPRCGSLPRAGGETAVTVVGLARAAKPDVSGRRP